MKLLYFIDGYTANGGTERVLSMKTSYLIDKYNYDISIVSFKEDMPPFFHYHDKVKFILIDRWKPLKIERFKDFHLLGQVYRKIAGRYNYIIDKINSYNVKKILNKWGGVLRFCH